MTNRLFKSLLFVLALSGVAWAAGSWNICGDRYTPQLTTQGTTDYAQIVISEARTDTRLGASPYYNGASTIAGAISAISTTPVQMTIPAGTWTVADNLTIPANVSLKVMKGATITVTGGKTLTINGPFDAGVYQVFATTGTVAFGPGTVKEVYPEWWATNTTPGTTDMGAAIQAAVTSNPRGVVAFGNTSYKSTATITSTAGVWLKGSGIGNTIITKAGDADLFALSGSAWNDQFAVTGMTVAPGTNMSSGAAFSIQDDSVVPTVTMEDVYIPAGGGYEFKYGVKVRNCNAPRFYNVTINGLDTTKLIAWNITLDATGAPTGTHTPKWFGCEVNNANTGIEIVSSVSPGIEGTQLYGCDMASVAYGFVFTNTVAGYTYFPPQISLIGGHINATVRCIDVTKAAEVVVKGMVLYLTPITAAQEAIRLTSCGDVIVSGNYIWTKTTGITLTSGTSVYGGTINDNIILGAAGYNAINFTATNFLSMIIKNNQQNGADETVHVTGVMAAKVVVADNYPPDTVDGYVAVDVTITSPGEGDIDISGVRSNVIYINTVAGATNINNIIPRRDNDIITLIPYDSNLTFKYAGPGNIFLYPGSDYNLPTGVGLTLARTDNTWQQIGRSYWP
jgi:hypothetical protein